MLIGTAAPVLRSLVNGVIRRWRFTDAMGPAWLRHNVEEVGNFEHFLPALYARCAGAWDGAAGT